MSLLFLFLKLLVCAQSVPERASCNETEQCVADVIHAKEIYCDGYLGCIDSTIIANKSIFCDGSNACRRSSLTGTMINCNGKSSCYNTTKLISAGTVVCQGQYSCAWSKQLTSVTLGVNCGGYMSCMHSNISNTGIIIANGERALVNANIDSKDSIIWYADKSPGIIVQIKGYNAGAGANIYCRSKTDCKIECDGTGCSGLNIYCYYGATCNIDPPECPQGLTYTYGLVPTINGVVCPKYYTSTSLDEDLLFNKYIEVREIDRANALNKFLQENEKYDNDYNRIKMPKENKINFNDIDSNIPFNNGLDRHNLNTKNVIGWISIIFVLIFIVFCVYTSNKGVVISKIIN